MKNYKFTENCFIDEGWSDKINLDPNKELHIMEREH